MHVKNTKHFLFSTNTASTLKFSIRTSITVELASQVKIVF